MDTIVLNKLVAYSPIRRHLAVFVAALEGLGWLDRLSPQSLTFQNIKSMPAGLAPDHWIDWAIANWGTKWDAVFGDDLRPGGLTWFKPGERMRDLHCVEYETFSTHSREPWPLFPLLRRQYPSVAVWWHSVSTSADFERAWCSDYGTIEFATPQGGGSAADSARQIYERSLDAQHVLSALPRVAIDRKALRGEQDAPRQTTQLEILVRSVPAESPNVPSLVADH